MTTNRQVTPRGDRILIRPCSYREIVGGLLEVPEDEYDGKKERPQGEVVAVGPECSPDLQPGLFVLFDPYESSDVRLDGVEHVIVHDEAVGAFVGD